MKLNKVFLFVTLAILLCAGRAIAQPKLVIKALAEKKVAELPAGPLFWRLAGC